MDKQTVIDGTCRWISSMVIGLNLCPFAERVFKADKIRYVVTDAQEETTLLKDLADELEALASSPTSSVETTLLIHPYAFGNFLDYNDFLGACEALGSDHPEVAETLAAMHIVAQASKDSRNPRHPGLMIPTGKRLIRR
jgi:hypothetical protein